MNPRNSPKPDDGPSRHEVAPQVEVNPGTAPFQFHPPNHLGPDDFVEPEFEAPPDLSDDVNEFGPFHVIHNHAVVDHHDGDDDGGDPMDVDMREDDDPFQPVLPLLTDNSDGRSPIGIPALTPHIQAHLKTCPSLITHFHTMDIDGLLTSVVPVRANVQETRP